MKNLVPSFKESILNEYSEDTIKQIHTVLAGPLETLCNEEIIKSIPIINEILNSKKDTLFYNDKVFIKNLGIFISNINIGLIEPNIHLAKLGNNSEEINEKLEKILKFIYREDEDNKTIIIAQLYNHYISKFITESQFMSFARITNDLSLTILKDFKKFADNVKTDSEEYIDYQSSMKNLSILHLVVYENNSPRLSSSGNFYYENLILNSGINLD